MMILALLMSIADTRPACFNAKQVDFVDRQLLEIRQAHFTDEFAPSAR